MVVVSFLVFENHYFQAQARYLFPALCPIAIGFGQGFRALAGRKPAYLACALGVALLGLNWYAVSRIETTLGAASPSALLRDQIIL